MYFFPLLIVIIFLFAAGPVEQIATGYGLSGMEFSDFKMRGFDDDDEELSWQLQGGRAVIRGSVIEISELQLRMERPHGTAIDVFSPACIFNRVTSVGQSSSSIKATGRNMLLEGEGYHFSLDQQKMHLHSDVRMVIQHGERSLFSVSRGGEARE